MASTVLNPSPCCAAPRWHLSAGQQQERYTPSASHDASDAEDSDDSDEQQQQQQHSPGAGSRQLTPQQLHHHHHLQQQSQPGSASVLAQYACSSAAGSEDDVCQWQSPIRPTVRQQQQQRAVLQDIQNSPVGAARHAGSAVRHHKHSSWGPQQQQQGSQPVPTPAVAGTTLTVEADDLQVLLDKVGCLYCLCQRHAVQRIVP